MGTGLSGSQENVDMFVDAHQHFWVYDPVAYDWSADAMGVLCRNFLPEDLRPELDRSGFRGSLAVQACQTVAETRWLLDLAERCSWILGVVGWVDLCSNDVHSQLAALAKYPKLVGIRLVAGSYGAVVHMIKGYLDHHNLSARKAVLGKNAKVFYRLS